MKVKDILKNKGPEVFTISEDKKITDAVKTLTNNNIGVLLVLDSQAKIAGIISERDIIKALGVHGAGYTELCVKDIMSVNLIVVEPEDKIEYVESIMTENRIRHLPVIKDKVLAGLISIGDIVKNELTNTRYDNKYLMDYISGNVK